MEEVTEEHATLSQTDRNSNTVAGHLIIIVIFAILIIIVILTTLIAQRSMVLSLYKRCFCCNAAPEAQRHRLLVAQGHRHSTLTGAWQQRISFPWNFGFWCSGGGTMGRCAQKQHRVNGEGGEEGFGRREGGSGNPVTAEKRAGIGGS